MDDFKRFYSNNDEVESVPYFWQKFDKEHYSIWRCDYKYADELTMVFMSCNLMGGKICKFYQSQSVAYLNSAPIYVCNYDVTIIHTCNSFSMPNQNNVYMMTSILVV